MYCVHLRKFSTKNDGVTTGTFSFARFVAGSVCEDTDASTDGDDENDGKDNDEQDADEDDKEDGEEDNDDMEGSGEAVQENDNDEGSLKLVIVVEFDQKWASNSNL